MNFLIKKLLEPKGMEYLSITKDLMIEDMSYGVKRFADLADTVEIGQDCRLGYPELIGMENMLMQILWGGSSSLELKGISRTNQKQPLYIDLYILGGQEQPNLINHNLLIFFEDVTDRMLLEQSLAQRSHEAALLLSSLTATKDYLQKIVTAIADALIVVTKSGAIKTINPAAQELFGYREDELINQPISLITSSHIFPDTYPQTIEVNCQKKDTSILTVAFSCSIIQTEVAGIDDLVYIGRDMTEQLQIQENLNLARTKAEEASQTKSLFLANMSHEIRTPMNGVLGLTELLAGTTLEPVQREFIEGIRTSGRNLLTIINEILDLSKLEAGQVQAEEYEFDLRNCVEDVVDLLAPLAHGKNLELTCMINPNLPIAIWGDRAKLGQILTNFLSNAIKFTAVGEIIVLVEPDPETGINFSVIDQGIGISAETINKLFTPFTQADNSTTRKYGGTGLGLAICKQLTQLMDGKIGVESKVGEGSRFWVSLPYDTNHADSDHQSQEFRFSGQTLLVVDSHTTTRWLVSTYAQSWGFNVAEASNKEEALDVLAAHPAPDLVITELALANIPELNHLPVIIVTRTNPEDTQLAIARNSDSYFLPKPLRLTRLLKSIENALYDHLPTQSRVNPPSTPSPKILNILLAEDNIINQKVASTLLKNLGHTVEIAANGAEVLKLLSTNSYDIILMDCQMPVLDGFATTAQIRQQEASAGMRTIIIAVTANAMKEDKEQCLASGMDDYLSKPFYKTEIEAMLKKWAKS